MMRNKIIKKICVCTILLLIAMLFTGCHHFDRNGKLWYKGNSYSMVYDNEYFVPISYDYTWKTIGWTDMLKKVLISPNEEICIIGARYIYVRDDCVFPDYMLLQYDGAKIVVKDYAYAPSSDILTMDAIEEFAPISIDAIIDGSICMECDFKEDYRFFLQAHCVEGFYWNFHIFVVDNKYYIKSINEDFGYLVVDEFADWLRSLEPSQN